MKKSSFIIFAAVFLILVGALGITYYLLRAAGGPVSQTEDTAALIAKIGELIVLPQGENPTVATVIDPELLRNQPFFANAKKGDRVLIYPIARKAILYDPVSNKIVEVAPIDVRPPQETSQNQETRQNQ